VRLVTSVLLITALGCCLGLSLVRITFSGDYPALGLLGPPQSIAWRGEAGTPLTPPRNEACSSLGVGAFSFRGAALLVGGGPDEQRAFGFCGDVLGEPPAGVGLGGQPALAAAIVLILVGVAVNAAGLPGRGPASAIVALVAVALLAAESLGPLTLSVPGHRLPSGLLQAGPDVGFWVSVGLLAAVSLINVPPGRWVGREGRGVIGI
jgi:hypothetical protein